MSEKIPPFEEKLPILPEKQGEEAPSVLAAEKAQSRSRRWINPEGSDGYDIELSPEEVEKVLEKVQDINENGTAYSVVGADKTDMGGNRTDSLYLIQKVLREGLIAEGRKDRWAKETRERENIMLHFNIVGRSVGNEKINKSYWWHKEAIAPVFDMEAFHEVEPTQWEKEIKSFWVARGGFRGHDLMEIWNKYFKGLKPGDLGILEHPEFERLKKEKLLDENGKPLSETDFGFQLFSRVAPRYFRGLVLGREHGRVISAGAHGSIIEYPHSLIAMMKEENIWLPLYDDSGNLLWPKPMWYKGIKKLVAEREQNKKKKA